MNPQMIESEKNKSIPFRVTEARREELKIAAARRRHSLQEMLERGLDLLLAGNAPQLAQAPPRAIANARWHQLLDEVLASGKADVVKAVQQNIEILHRYALTKPTGPIQPVTPSPPLLRPGDRVPYSPKKKLKIYDLTKNRKRNKDDD